MDCHLSKLLLSNILTLLYIDVKKKINCHPQNLNVNKMFSKAY